MRLMTRTAAHSLPIVPEPWADLAVNADRAAVASRGFVHDVYRARLTEGSEDSFQRATEHLLSYQIFAPARMTSRVCTPNGRVVEGALIIQRVVFGAIAIETAVRVVEVMTTPDEVRFAYATLAGHPERGIASFAVVRNGDVVEFVAEAWSRSGHWLTILGRPFSRFLQRRITVEAVAHFVATASPGPTHFE